MNKHEANGYTLFGHTQQDAHVQTKESYEKIVTAVNLKILSTCSISCDLQKELNLCKFSCQCNQNRNAQPSSGQTLLRNFQMLPSA